MVITSEDIVSAEGIVAEQKPLAPAPQHVVAETVADTAGCVHSALPDLSTEAVHLRQQLQEQGVAPEEARQRVRDIILAVMKSLSDQMKAAAFM